jgi:DNA-binding ferritin-like protein
MDKISELIRLIISAQYKMRLTHWRICGNHFDSIHNITDEYVDKLGDLIDELTEMLMSMGGNPVTFSSCNDSELDSMDVGTKIDADIALQIIKSTFQNIIKKYQELSQENLPSVIHSKLDEEEYWFIIENNFKTRLRMCK